MSSLFDFTWMQSAGAWVGLLTLVALEIVLGIDNIIFISILSGKLPADQQPRARKLGLVLAVIPRILLLLFIPLVLSLDQPLFYLPIADPDPAHKGQNLGLSVQNLIVVVGGLFLIGKATHEIHHKLEGAEHTHAVGEGTAPNANVAAAKSAGASFVSVMVQIMLLNIVFSIDSIITAIGMVEQVTVMILAVVISTGVMAIAINPVSAFVERHPTVKMLALAFLLLIGTTLIIEGIHFHIPKGYVYFAMGFSVFVEMLNIRATSKNKPVLLREPHA